MEIEPTRMGNDNGCTIANQENDSCSAYVWNSRGHDENIHVVNDEDFYDEYDNNIYSTDIRISVMEVGWCQKERLPSCQSRVL